MTEKEPKPQREIVTSGKESLGRKKELPADYQRSQSSPIRSNNKYNTATQIRLVASGFTQGDLATRKDLPTLDTLRRDSGEEKTISWISSQVAGISDFAGVGQGLSERQITEMASFILGAYHYLTLAEICLFVARYKMGYYGSFYGSVDPLRIMAALRDFVKTRGEDIDRIERERHSAALALDMTEREGAAISYEEYRKIKAREKAGGKMPEKYPEMPQD